PFTFPQRRANNTYQIADTFLARAGGHALKFGGDVRRVQLNSVLERNYRSQVTFSPAFVKRSVFDPPSSVVYAPGLSFAVLGAPTDVFQTLAITPDASLGLR